MFSSRLHWDLEPNPISKLLARKRAAGAEILDLTESNPTTAGFAAAPEVLEALTDPRALTYEPLPAGLRWARNAISEYYGGQVEPDRVLLTTSTSEAYAYLFKLLTGPGDEILTPRPSYPLFEFLTGMELAKPVAYSLDFEDLERAATSQTRAIVVVNPNNPTGAYIKKDQLKRLIEFCQKRDLAIVSDEVFAGYGFGESEARVPSFINVNEVLTFSLSGLSKAAGLPQMKLGWIVVSGPRQLRQAALDRLELIADTYLSVNTPVQWAAPKLLEAGRAIQRKIQDRTAKNLHALRRVLGSNPAFRLQEPEGGWTAVIEAPRIRTEEQWALNLLEQENVLVQPGYFYDFDREAYLIVSLLTPVNVFAEGVRRMVSFAPPSNPASS